MAVKDVKPYKIGDKLTPRQEKWIDEYIKCDNLAEATVRAGYSPNQARAMGYQNSIKFKELLDARRKELSEQLKKENIAELEDIFVFWTKTLNDGTETTRERLKASELLAKAKGAFVEKREVKVVDTDWFIDG